ncbi:hypothetical protein O181_091199 [Austropuccinia psidii MF-1]|uniref:Uncharacterized protein n=1 Tax=Austropuccinia psidii MF-1 TaxID=1389203 RepID=A0A9Q3IX31_9BASI|nr:hypothetical protein [Austropuccinia psidii MF-1]
MVHSRGLLLHRNWLPHLPSSSPPVSIAYAQAKLCFGTCHHICPITHPCAAPAPYLMILILLQCRLNFVLPAITHPCALAPPMVSMLNLVQCLIDMPLTPPPHLCPHPPAYNVYAPEVPSNVLN